MASRLGLGARYQPHAAAERLKLDVPFRIEIRQSLSDVRYTLRHLRPLDTDVYHHDWPARPVRQDHYAVACKLCFQDSLVDTVLFVALTCRRISACLPTGVVAGQSKKSRQPCEGAHGGKRYGEKKAPLSAAPFVVAMGLLDLEVVRVCDRAVQRDLDFVFPLRPRARFLNMELVPRVTCWIDAL
jgi:hypothetical protein